MKRFYVFPHIISASSQQQVVDSQQEKHHPSSFKVMSYNVRLFDLYNWSHNKETRNKIFNLIKKEGADIICFQEFFHSDKKKYFNTLDTLLKFQKATNYHAKYTYTVLDAHHFGIATFSAFPIINKGSIDFLEGAYNTCIFTDIKVNNDTIRVYNAHLASIHFGKEEYDLLEVIDKNTEAEQLKEGMLIIGKQLKNAFIKRASQAELIAKHIAQSPYPVILCSDFNDTPTSYTYHTISRNLTDAFVISGSGTGNTYIGKFPSFRIDYIFYSNELHSYNFTTLTDKLSDHYPITCYVEVSCPKISLQ